jgi:hypothetical protein
MTISESNTAIRATNLSIIKVNMFRRTGLNKQLQMQLIDNPNNQSENPRCSKKALIEIRYLIKPQLVDESFKLKWIKLN